MSTTIESRVVEMKFDNSNFERNVQQSMNTLTALKKSLNFDGTAASLDSVAKAAQNLDVSSVSESVSQLSSGFSALEVAAISAISNITGRLVDMGVTAVKSLTIDPIMSGLSEYETKMGSVQTILANTSDQGTTLEDVTKALDELNTYSDKTIYNFTEMTRNIGTFTAAGVDLKTSTNSIKGIANLAAVSGSTSQQASTAMYQLSQALAAGKVSLQDWNSVVNAGMGGKVFQNALIRTSEALGTGAQAAINQYGSFRESLTKGEWLTKEVLTTTLNQFAGAYDEAELMAMGFTKAQTESILAMAKTAEEAATVVKTGTMLIDTLKEEAQSGWSQSWEIIIGDFEEAKKFWTSINNIISPAIGAAADFRNAMLQVWKDSGGRDDAIKGLKIGLKSIINVINAVKEAFHQVFGDATERGKVLASLSKSFASFMQKIKPSQKTLDGLRGTIRGILSIVKLLMAPIIAVLKVTSAFVAPLVKVGYAILQVTGKIGDLIGNVVDAIFKFEGFGKIIDTLCGWIQTAGNWVADLIKKLAQKINFGSWEESTSIFEKMKTALEKVKDALKGVTDAIKKAWDGFVKFWTEGEMPDFIGMFKAIGSGIVAVFKWIADAAKAVWAKLDEWGVVDVLKTIWETIKMIGTAIKDQIVGGLEKMGKGDFSTLIELLALVGGILTGKKLNDLTGAFEGLIKNLSGLFSKDNRSFFKEWLEGLISPLTAMSTKIKSEALWNVAKSIALLAAALFMLALVDDKKLLMVAGVLTALVAELMGVVTGLSKLTGIKFVSMVSAVIGLVGVCTALLILAAAIKMIANLKPEELWSSVAAIIVLVMALVKMVDHLTGAGTLDKGKTLKSVAALRALKSLAIAVLILCAAISLIAKYEPNQLIPAVLAVMFLIAELTIAMKMLKVNNNEGTLKSMGILISFAFAITKLAKTIRILGNLPFKNLAQGVGTMVVIIGMLIGMMAVIQKAKLNQGQKIKRSIGTMIALASSLFILATALRILGSMDFGEILKGLIGLAGCMAVMVAALVSLGKFGSGEYMVRNAGSLTLLALSLIPMALAMRVIGTMDTWSWIKAIVGMTVAIRMMAACIKSLSGVTSLKGAVSIVIVAAALNELAIAFLMFNGVSIKSLIVGLTAFVVVLGTLAVAATAFAAAGPAMRSMAITMAIAAGAVAALAIAFDILVTVLIKLATLSSAAMLAIGAAVKKMSLMFIGFIPELGTALLAALAKLLPTLAGLIKDTVLTLLGLVKDLAGPTVNTLLGVLIDILGAIESHISEIVDKVMSIIIKVVNAVAKRTPELVKAVVNLVAKVIEGLVDAINSNSISFEKLYEAMKIVGLMLLTCAGFLVSGALAIAGLLVATVAIAELIGFLALLGAMNQIPGLAWFVEEGGKLLSVIANAIGNFIGNLIGSAVESFSGHLEGIGNNLVDFINCFSGIDRSVVECIDILATAMLKLAGADFLDAIASWIRGSSNVSTFGDTIKNFGDGFKEFTNSISDIDDGTVEKVKMAAESIKILADACSTIPTSGGLWGLLFGNTNYEGFLDALPRLGSGLAQFNTNLGSDFNSDTAKNAADGLKAIAEGCNLIPEKDGLLQKLIGTTDYDGFYEAVPKLGTAIKEFATNAGKVKKSAVNGAEALKAICEGVNLVPKEEGLLQKLIGGVNLEKFSTELPNMGAGIAKFAAALKVDGSDIDLTTAERAASVLNAICTALSNTPVNGGWWQAISGDVTFEEFRDGLPMMAEGIVGFVKTLAGDTAASWFSNTGKATGITEDAIAMAEKAGELVKAITASLADTPTDIDTKITNFGKAIESLQKIITETEVSSDSMTSATNIKDYLDTLTPSFNAVGEIDMDKIQGLSTNLGAIATNSVSSFTKPFNDAEKEVRGIGEKLVTWAQSGLSGLIKKASMYTDAAALSSAAVSGFKSKRNDAEYAGAYLNQGIIEGLKTKHLALYNEGIASATEFLKGYKSKKGADEHSPSKKMIQSGKYLAEGLIIGVQSLSDQVFDAGSEMGNASVEAVSRSISNISKIVSGEVDVNPTIRPVLDLSDISSKASSIGDMLSGYSVTARVGSVAGSMNSTKVDSTNTDVVNAISKLESAMSGRSGDNYTINGVTYDDGTNIAIAAKDLIRAIKMERRV